MSQRSVIRLCWWSLIERMIDPPRLPVPITARLILLLTFCALTIAGAPRAESPAAVASMVDPCLTNSLLETLLSCFISFMITPLSFEPRNFFLVIEKKVNELVFVQLVNWRKFVIIPDKY